MDHQLLEGGVYHPQQQVFLIEDDHEPWPMHPGPAAAGPAALAAEPLPPLASVGSRYPGKPVAPMIPVGAVGGLEDDDLTVSEDDSPLHTHRSGTAALAAWQLPQPGASRRPESALTAASQQPSPTPSVSLAGPPAAAPQSAPAAPAARGGSKGGAKARKPGGKGGITLRLLIEEGVLQPAHNVLSVDYKGMKQLATLMPDGRISSSIRGQTMVFESPSAFSIYLKRLVNPTRKADDGWKTVRYKNRVLEQYKADLVKRRMGEASSGGGFPASLPAVPSDQQMAQQHWQQQQQQAAPPLKRARVDSSSDLTGGSVAVSATVKEGDRNVLKLKFARPRRGGDSTGAPGSAEQGYLQGAAYEAEQQTEYQRSRPRRRVQAPPRYAALGLDDEHALQPLEAFAEGPPGAPGAQPFTLYISPAAEVVMDFHAHLCSSEVIGVLAGVFDPITQTISVLRAHPVRELGSEDGAVNVEMDPEDEWAVRQQVGAEGMRVVGWYHSHPTFPTQPSTIDIYNQVVQQHHHRDNTYGVEPYVAAIVGPYDKRHAGAASSISWFYVEHPPGAVPGEGERPEALGCVAKAMQTLRLLDGGEGGVQAEIAALPSTVLRQLAERYASRRDAVSMAGAWRDRTSCLQKMATSLLSRLPPSHLSPAHMEDFSAQVHDIVMATMVQQQAPGSFELAGNGATSAGMAAGASVNGRGLAEPESEEEISDLSA